MMSSSSCRMTNSNLLESSTTTASVEIAQDIIEDVSGDDDSTSNAQPTTKTMDQPMLMMTMDNSQS